MDITNQTYQEIFECLLSKNKIQYIENISEITSHYVKELIKKTKRFSTLQLSYDDYSSLAFDLQSFIPILKYEIENN